MMESTNVWRYFNSPASSILMGKVIDYLFIVALNTIVLDFGLSQNKLAQNKLQVIKKQWESINKPELINFH